ncbi:MAG: hypothetical protein D6820_09015, partial [Lentisphaerae bacterium]
MIASITIFLIVYFFIATEKIEKSVAAIIGACVAIAMGLISFEHAWQAVDWNVIFLLMGMMTCVGILAQTGFFEFVAVWLAKKAKGNAALIMILLLGVTMLFSALLDNVTTVVLLAPVTILIAQVLELDALPFIILEAVASNIGGTATLIGDPPNIIIGSQGHLSFNAFLIHLTPEILVNALIFCGTVLFIFRKSLRVPDSVRMRVIHSYPALAIRDRKNMIRALIIFALIFAGFFLHHTLHLEPGVIALGGMALMLLICHAESEEMLKAVEWDALLFFIGLFMIIGAMEHNHVIEFAAGKLTAFCGDRQLFACLVILWGSAIFSAILDNIPFVMAMMPLVMKMVQEQGADIHSPHPYYWALALGACLGGN